MPVPKFGRTRSRAYTGKVGAFLTGGFSGQAQPAPPAPKPPKQTKQEKGSALIEEMYKQGTLKPKYYRGLKKR